MMRSLHIGGVLLLVMVCCCVGQDYTEWIKAVENEDELGRASLTFNCSEFPDHPRPTEIIGEGDDEIQVPPYNHTIDLPVSWMLPNLDIIEDIGDINGGKYFISADRQQMIINNVTKDDFGVYHCMVWVTSDAQTGDRYYLVKWGVNMRGPYFENLWDKYRTNTIIACSASGGFTAFMIIICLVYQYRWQAPGSDTDDKKDLDGYAGKSKPPIHGADNKAYINEYTEPQPTTSSGSAFSDSEKPPLPADSFTTTASPTVTYSTFPEGTPEVEADTRF